MASVDPIAGEAWYPIPSFPGYELSSESRVRSLGRNRRRHGPPSWHLMKIKANRKGYLYFEARRDGKKWYAALHQIVAELAFGPAPEGAQVLHLDDDRTNNHASNLAYGSHLDNVADAIRNGRYRRGERHGLAKYPESVIRDIRSRVASGESQRVVASAYGMRQTYVSSICRRKVWAHLD